MTKILLTPWSNRLQKVHSQMTNLWLRLDQVFLFKALSVFTVTVKQPGPLDVHLY